jgi:hypothetical protein
MEKRFSPEEALMHEWIQRALLETKNGNEDDGEGK